MSANDDTSDAVTPARDPLPGLTAALDDLVQRSAFRITPGAAGWISLRRDAERLLKKEVAAGRVTKWTLSVGPDEDEPDVAVIEAHVALPRRVEQVVIRVTQASPGG